MWMNQNFWNESFFWKIKIVRWVWLFHTFTAKTSFLSFQVFGKNVLSANIPFFIEDGDDANCLLFCDEWEREFNNKLLSTGSLMNDVMPLSSGSQTFWFYGKLTVQKCYPATSKQAWTILILRHAYKPNQPNGRVKVYFGGTPTYSYDTQRFRGTPVENHCLRLSSKVLVTTLGCFIQE